MSGEMNSPAGARVSNAFPGEISNIEQILTRI